MHGIILRKFEKFALTINKSNLQIHEVDQLLVRGVEDYLLATMNPTFVGKFGYSVLKNNAIYSHQAVSDGYTYKEYAFDHISNMYANRGRGIDQQISL